MQEKRVLLQIQNLYKTFLNHKKVFEANHNLNFTIYEEETLSIIGESGSGKSTLGKMIVQLQKPDSGQILYYSPTHQNALSLNELKKKEMKLLRREVQIIFQDSFSSLDPKFKIRDIIGQGLLIQKKVKNKKDLRYEKEIIEIAENCGLKKDLLDRYPHELSGGQRQRVNIAKTLILKPKFIVCDEIVSALDVTVQKQVLDLLSVLKKKYQMTYLFISHDLGVARYISDRIGVMEKGRLVELAPTEELFNNPLHPYTQKLLNAIPVLPQYANLGQKHSFQNEQKGFSFSSDFSDRDFYEVKKGHFVLCTLDQKKDKKA
ncbi:ABC transporter ATP-binding protein [Candidatus Phytoplasma pruni]|uniref:ABC transporter ATP-binding protein n=1 Tax=Candidatus Phytoplasma pruni TaxID=479893 RepID=A0A851H9A8_9MOLU|nr:ATP-binding cassette domain-containing protein [Candidatus Phytoplasma pruni]NWN45512.1 ABC transporter ATP-binding protein [Candidatus Phytoplasma pruni]